MNYNKDAYNLAAMTNAISQMAREKAPEPEDLAQMLIEAFWTDEDLHQSRFYRWSLNLPRETQVRIGEFVGAWVEGNPVEDDKRG